MAFPFYWMLATSFKSPQEALQAEPVWVPERMKPVNWLKAARLGDSPLFGGLGPGRSVALFFPGPEAPPPRALVPRSPGAFFDPVADGTRVEVVRGEGGWWVRLTNTGEAGFRRVPLVVLWPKGVPLEPPLPPDARRSQGEYWRLEWVNAVPGALGYVFHNYLEAWDAAPWGRYFFVSFFTASVQVAVGLFLAALAAFALARIPFPGKEAVFVLVLATMMVPGEVLLSLCYGRLARLGWLDTFYALIVPWLASVFGIFLLRQFYLSLPQDLFDAARIDGAGFFGISRHVILPLSVPAFVVVAIWQFTQIWNEFLFAVTLTRPESQPITVALAQLAGGEAVKWNLPMAGAILAALPTLLVYILLGRYFLRGLLAGSVKG